MELQGMTLSLLFLSLLPLTLSTSPGTSGSVPTHHVPFGISPPGINGEPPQPNAVEQYLSDFGYTSRKLGDVELTPFDMQMGLLRFQLYHGLYRSGEFDDETESKMTLQRCANADMQNGAALKGSVLMSRKFRGVRLRLNTKFLKKLHLDIRPKELWKKKVITWNVTGHPLSLTEKDTRDAAIEAFSKWQSVAEFVFVEVGQASEADINVIFKEIKDNKNPGVVAQGSGPEDGRIVIDKTKMWTHNIHMPGSLNLLRTLIHEIGHTLGLQHVPEEGSVMNPLFKTATSHAKIEGIPLEDKISLRKLYGLSIPVNTQTVDSEGPKRKCPKYLDSVTAVNDDTWFLFKDYSVYKIKNGKIEDNHVRISEFFPQGPDFVNATVTSKHLTLLFAERTIYGYEYDGERFTPAEGFPRELHERVLFYPQAAFPLNNGSVVLISGNVFATYKVEENVPVILNDRSRVFPNLPYDVLSGIPKSKKDFEEYWMFDETTVSDWSSITKQVSSVVPITEFFKCA